MQTNYDREGDMREVQTEQQMEAFRTLAETIREKIDRTKVERWDKGELEKSLLVLKKVNDADSRACYGEYIATLEGLLRP